jgi:hypothetical protein
MKFPSDDDKIKALKREIALRKRVYPRRVQTHQMSQAAADWEVEVMQSILDDYEHTKRMAEQAELWQESR